MKKLVQKSTGATVKVPYTAEDIADQIEAEAKRLLAIVDILRGKK